MADLRNAAELQKLIGTYEATDREIPALAWVWMEPRYAYSFGFDIGPNRDLGVVLEISKSRDKSGAMNRRYIVLTLKHGQVEVERGDLILATFYEVRELEGLSVNGEIEACIEHTRRYGPSEANTLRFANAQEDAIKMGICSVDCPGLCVMLVTGEIPKIILTGQVWV